MERIEKLGEIILEFCDNAKGTDAVKIDNIAAGHVNYLPAACFEKEKDWVDQNKTEGHLNLSALHKGAEDQWAKFAQLLYIRLPRSPDAPLTRAKLLEPIIRKWTTTLDEEEFGTITAFLVQAARMAASDVQQMVLKKALNLHEPGGWDERRARLLKALNEANVAEINEVYRGLAHALTRYLMGRPNGLQRVIEIASKELIGG
jgi:hypothetical protein